jgi:hypothetical protein
LDSGQISHGRLLLKAVGGIADVRRLAVKAAGLKALQHLPERLRQEMKGGLLPTALGQPMVYWLSDRYRSNPPIGYVQSLANTVRRRAAVKSLVVAEKPKSYADFSSFFMPSAR